MAKKNGESKNPKKEVQVEDAVVIEDVDVIHQADYRRNHEKIREALLQCIQGKPDNSDELEEEDGEGDTMPTPREAQIYMKEVPTLAELAEMTGLSTKTIERHMKTMHFQPMDHPLQILNDDVLLNLFNLTKRSDRACLLWAKLMMGYRETAHLNVKGAMIQEVKITIRGSQSNLLDGL